MSWVQGAGEVVTVRAAAWEDGKPRSFDEREPAAPVHAVNLVTRKTVCGGEVPPLVFSDLDWPPHADQACVRCALRLGTPAIAEAHVRQ